MKKKNQDRKPRRLSLKRETIQNLADPALLALAKGGNKPVEETCQTTSSLHPDTGAC